MPRIMLAGMAMLFACTAQAGDLGYHSDDPVNSSVSSLWLGAADTPIAPLVVGDDAPSFSFMSSDGKWHEFKELSSHGSLLLVFGASAEDLKALEQTRALFLDLGVTPVAALDRRPASAGKFARRVGLSCPIISDPQCAIGWLYGSLDPLSHRHAPAFFVLDEKRTIRALGHGELPTAMKMLWVTARGLGRPLPESARSALSG
jgi:peroxiredoxin